MKLSETVQYITHKFYLSLIIKDLCKIFKTDKIVTLERHHESGEIIRKKNKNTKRIFYAKEKRLERFFFNLLILNFILKSGKCILKRQIST